VKGEWHLEFNLLTTSWLAIGQEERCFHTNQSNLAFTENHCGDVGTVHVGDVGGLIQKKAQGRG
jgi:hypothetical protein